MPLKIEITNHGAGPVIVCDHCGERIADAAEGNYEWARVIDTPGERVAVYFLHKWCSPAFEQRRGLVLDSMELTVMLPYLAQNLQLDWDKAWSQAETLSEF